MNIILCTTLLILNFQGLFTSLLCKNNDALLPPGMLWNLLAEFEVFQTACRIHNFLAEFTIMPLKMPMNTGTLYCSYQNTFVVFFLKNIFLVL